MYFFTILLAIFYCIIYGNWIGGCLVASLFLVLFFSIYFSRKDCDSITFSCGEDVRIFMEGDEVTLSCTFGGKTFYNNRDCELIYFVKSGLRQKRKKHTIKFSFGKKKYEKISLKLGNLLCDRYEIEFAAMKWKDLTGIYTVEFELYAKENILVLPKRYPMEFMEDKVRKKAQGYFADYDGIRPYQPGDRLSNIHWNIFAGKGELYVRKYEKEERKPQNIVLTRKGVPLKKYSDYFSIFYSVSTFLIEHGISQEIYFGSRSYFLTSMEQYEELFYFIFSESLETVPEIGRKQAIWIHLDKKYKTVEDALYDMELE